MLANKSNNVMNKMFNCVFVSMWQGSDKDRQTHTQRERMCKSFDDDRLCLELKDAPSSLFLSLSLPLAVCANPLDTPYKNDFDAHHFTFCICFHSVEFK